MSYQKKRTTHFALFKELLDTFGKFIQYQCSPESCKFSNRVTATLLGFCYTNFLNTSFQTSVHLKNIFMLQVVNYPREIISI